MAKIVVVGAGTMGAGIAAVAAMAGDDVVIVDPDASSRSRASALFEKLGCGARVQSIEAMPPALDAALAIEAVPERLDLKRAVFASLAAALPKTSVLVTNTSSLSVSEIAENVIEPQRVVGLHFFNPPVKMQLVEIVRAKFSGEEAIDAARATVERFGKTAVVTADTPGFIVNRVARPFYLQAMRAYEAGVAPVEELDRIARGAGFRMGPFELMDLIGLDVNLATSESIYDRTNAARLEPIQLQREMVAQGKLGRKSGAGFYDYKEDGTSRHDEPPLQPAAERNADERLLLIGLSNLAIEWRELLDKTYQNVNVCENAEAVDELPLDATVVIDTGDGVSDRSAFVAELDSLYPPETAILVDAYATDVSALAERLKHPERVVGCGILGSLERQNVIEIVDAEATGDNALELAQDMFESLGKRVALVEDRPGLFLGRTVASIVNEAVYAVQEGVAAPEDIDLAMRLGVNYPIGPIAWGREIGGDRIARILGRLAREDGAAFAPHRALWVLDVQDEENVMDVAVAEGAVESKTARQIFPWMQR